MQLTFDGGAKECSRCPAKAKEKRRSNTQLIIQLVIFIVLCIVVIIKLIKRKAGIDKERLMTALHLDKRKDKDEAQVQAVKREQEKYARLRPKLEMIAERLGKMNTDPQGNKSHVSHRSPKSKRVSTLGGRKSILYIGKSGDIMFDANEFFE